MVAAEEGGGGDNGGTDTDPAAHPLHEIDISTMRQCKSRVMPFSLDLFSVSVSFSAAASLQSYACTENRHHRLTVAPPVLVATVLIGVAVLMLG